MVLERGLARARLRPEQISATTMATLVPHLRKVAELFVDKTKRPALLAALREQQPAAPAPSTIEITSELDISRARVHARQLCDLMGAAPLTSQKVATVVSELARNIVDYTPGGRIELVPSLQPRPRLVIRALDSGAGIPNLQQILAGEYRSKTGLGVGLRGSKRLVDRFEINTGAQGTAIEAEVAL